MGKLFLSLVAGVFVSSFALAAIAPTPRRPQLPRDPYRRAMCG